MKISAVVLTKNEEKNIEKCLKSLQFCNEIIVVDDFSNDNTKEIVKKFKSLKVIKIIEKNLNGDFASQRNFGISKASFDWVLLVDADEEVSEELNKEIISIFKGKLKSDAYYLNRRDYFWGHEMKYGEVVDVRNRGIIRLIKKGTGKFLGNVHEVYYTSRNAGHLKNYINHFPHQTLTEFIDTINIYSSLRAQELFDAGKTTNVFDILFTPLIKFKVNYFLKLGFLDGVPGFVYAFLMSFHSFLVRGKLYLK